MKLLAGKPKQCCHCKYKHIHYGSCKWVEEIKLKRLERWYKAVINVSAILGMCFDRSFSSLGRSVMVLCMFSSLDRLKSRPKAVGLHIQQWLIGFPSVFVCDAGLSSLACTTFYWQAQNNNGRWPELIHLQHSHHSKNNPGHWLPTQTWEEIWEDGERSEDREIFEHVKILTLKAFSWVCNSCLGVAAVTCLRALWQKTCVRWKNRLFRQFVGSVFNPATQQIEAPRFTLTASCLSFCLSLAFSPHIYTCTHGCSLCLRSRKVSWDDITVHRWYTEVARQQSVQHLFMVRFRSEAAQ